MSDTQEAMIRRLHAHQSEILFSEVPAWCVVEWRQPSTFPWQMWLTLGDSRVLNLGTGEVHLVGGSGTKVVILRRVARGALIEWLRSQPNEEGAATPGPRGTQETQSL
jgi:hypothetical protein